MSRLLSALAILLVVASCGGRSTPPSDLENACNIVKERPKYLRAFKATERRWGVPVAVQMAIIYHESRYRSDARTPHNYLIGVIPIGRQSSAFGYSQALDGTWDEYKRETGKRRAKRDDIRDATDFMGWYMAKSKERNGISMSDARNQYLAYHEGHTGYSRRSYNKKSWLLRVSDQVEARAHMYNAQLVSCRRI